MISFPALLLSVKYYRRIGYYLSTFAAVVAVLLIAACSQAVKSEPEPKPPKPTLIGTWQFTWPEKDDDGMIVRTEILTLTFTNAGRFIDFYLVRDAEGNIEERWRETGTWTATQDTVTKTYHRWDEQNDRRFEEPTTVTKHYQWGDEARDVLFVHHWGSESEEHNYDRGVRLKNPIPYPLTGIWTGFRPSDVEGRYWTFTFGDSFTEHFDGGGIIFSLTGTWRIDEEHLFFFVTAESAIRTVGGVADDDFDPSEFVEHELRYAYAPTGLADTILLSPFGAERRYDDTTSMWIDHEGPDTSERYWMLLERQPVERQNQ